MVVFIVRLILQGSGDRFRRRLDLLWAVLCADSPDGKLG